MQFLSIAFGQAAHHKHLFDFALLLAVHQVQYHVDAFLFGVADEAAGVDHGCAAVQCFGVVIYAKSCFSEQVEQLLRVHQVF